MVDPNFSNGVPIFESLDAEERKVLADQVSIREFKNGIPILSSYLTYFSPCWQRFKRPSL